MKSNIKSFKSFKFFVSTSLLILLIFVTDSIFAFESVVIFGDSYSDDGNGVFKLSNSAFPPPPYFEGRFSNGPVWVEALSKRLDLESVNFAAGGATINSMVITSASGFNDEILVPGIRQQVNEYVTAAHEDGINSKGNNKLYVVTSFGSDYIYSIRHGPKVASPEQVIGQFITNLQTLYIEVGAINFLVTSLPDLSEFPGFSRSNYSEKAFIRKLVNDHNVLLKQAIKILKTDFKKIKTYLLDTKEFFNGYTFKESCLAINHDGTHICDDPDTYLFWDNLHITTKAHETLAAKAYDLLS